MYSHFFGSDGIAAIAMLYTLVLGVLFSTICVIIRLVLNYHTPGMRVFPGPAVAKFTNLWRLSSTFLGNHQRRLQKLHDRYGSVVRIGPKAISISDPNAIKAIYGLKANFPKSDFTYVMQNLNHGKIIPTLATVRDKHVHTALKKPIASVFTMTTAVKFEPYVDETIMYMVKRLDKEFIQGVGKGRPCDVDNWLQYFAFDVIGELAFGRSFGFLKTGSDVDHMIQGLTDTFIYYAIVGQMPWLDYYLRKNFLVTKLRKFTSPFAVRARRMLQARLAEKEVIPPSTQDRRDFVSHFIEAKETYPGEVSDQTLVGYIMTILLVGSDSTSVALRAIVYYILKNDKVLARLRQEIDDAKLTYPVSFKKSQELPYLDAVIKESHRYHPAGSILLEREVPETGLQLPDGRYVPAGTTVGMVGWTVHLNKEVFGADADTFNPDRWLQGGNETSEAFRLRLQGMKNAEITFGHGTRSCIGKHIAALEIYKLIPTMFGLFDIELVDPKKEWRVRSVFFARQYDMDIVLRWREGARERVTVT